MNNFEYCSLINDTLSYIKNLLPPKEEDQIVISSFARKEKAQALVKENPIKPKIDIRCPKEKIELKKQFIELDTPKIPPPQPNEEMRKKLKELDPNLYLHGTVPDDLKAKQIKNAWKEKRQTPAIPILFQGKNYRSFVEKIAKAIDTVYGSCRVVEIHPQKKWDLFLESENLRLIISPDTFIFGNKDLLSFYQETPRQKKRSLGKIPLLLIPDLGLYYKDPYIKRSLWNVICNTINSLLSS